MKRNILYTLLFSALCGCVEEIPPQPPVPGDGELVPIVYGVTRALGEDAPTPPLPTEVFTFISYRSITGNTMDITQYYPNAPYTTGTGADGINSGTNKHQGFYTYLPQEGTWKGIMQPCSIVPTPEAPDNSRWYSETRDPQSGQALMNAYYMSVCLRPGVELFNNGAGSERLLMTRNDVRYASRPFRINVQGYEVFPLPEPYEEGSKHTLLLQDLRSKVWFEIIQGTERTFTIPEPPKLMNAGYWGWYHPLLETTQISYEKGTRYDDSNDPLDVYENTYEFHDEVLDQPDDDLAATPPLRSTGRYSIYDKTDPRFQNAFSEEELDIDSGPAPTDGTGAPQTFYGPAAAGEGNVIYTTGYSFEQGIFFFSNRYRTSDEYLQPGIYFELSMGGEGFKINIPFDIDMEPNHAYLFRLTVESSVIRVHYRTVDWEGVQNNGGGLGGDQDDWTVLGTWSPAGWVPHTMNGGDNDIGDE